MHAHAAPHAQLAVDADRLVGADVRVAVPHRLVGADPDRGQVEACGKAGGDVLDVLRIAQVPREEEGEAGTGHGPGTPQGFVAVVQAARRPVVDRQELQFQAAQAGLVPPVEAGDARAVAAGHVLRQPQVDAQRRVQHGRAALLPVQRAQRCQRQVVVVRMADQDRIDVRQRREGHARRLLALRTGEGQRRGTVLEHRVEQDVHAVTGLQQEARVADPGQRRLGLVRMDVAQVGRHRRHRRQGQAFRAVRGPVPDAPGPAREEADFRPLVGGIRRIVVGEALGPVVRLARVMVGIDLRAACKQGGGKDGARQGKADWQGHGEDERLKKTSIRERVECLRRSSGSVPGSANKICK